MLDTRDAVAFDLTEEQRAVGALAREIAEREIAPHIAVWDREGVFPRRLYNTLGEAGLMGLTVPEAYGGAAADTISYALVIEELARIDAGAAVTLSVHAMICAAIARLGTDEQKSRYLERLASGEIIAGFALTEPDAGSDAAAIRATASRDGAGYLLRGRKQWCTNGSYAGVIMGTFRTGGAGAKGISAFLIDEGTPGMHVEKVTEKLGIHTSNTVDVAFDDARVAASALLGPEGGGLTSALSTLSAGRIGIAAQAVGILAACLEASVKFAKEREAFGKPVGAFEGVSFKIARMAMDLD
ncbi:MAG: acyl-CoA dehydrogenase family protein, partial [Candidatus Eremiobacteraeota bacterium]|nr:acyl-CoA dehydrogenase family protein [Candidatus Eremiobacteraeota bacterium]